MNLAEFIIRIESFNANVDIPLLRKAYEFSDKAHRGQFRESGDPYIEHCLNVAFILAEQHLDSATITAGMIHDVVEETEITLEQIKDEFDQGIALLVDGVTKIGEMELKSTEEQQVEYYRKMLLSMAKDIRVILIKLADRLHNMRTLEPLEVKRQKKISQETLEIYAPLAHRFGMAKIKAELEDLSLKYLDYQAFEMLENLLSQREIQREKAIQKAATPLKKELTKAGIKVKISGRTKHLYSIYRKMKLQQKPLEEIFDLVALRVIVDTEIECYQTLGIIHSLWAPIVNRFRDYIATPKSNMYQSLHTTVIGPEGRPVEIQIRTQTMHRTAEHGIAAHWLYKEGKIKPDKEDKQMIWLREVLEWQKDLRNPHEFLEYLKIDLFQEDIFVFTPGGEIKHLPRGSTTLDFAYAIHSEVGNRCVGAKVNGKLTPLSTVLRSGDEVQILTSPQKTPSRDWLKVVRTSRARSKIRHWLKQVEFEQSLKLGKEMLERELKKNHIKPLTEHQLSDLAMSLNFSDSEGLLSSLGQGDISIRQVTSKILPEDKTKKKDSKIEKIVEKSKRRGGIKVGKMKDLMFRFAGCCQPVPGEKIIGFVTRGRGISVHRYDCLNALSMLANDERRVEVEWDVERDQSFPIKLEVLVEDRKNILPEITKVIADSDTNIKGAEVKDEGNYTYGTFAIEVKNVRHLNRTVKKIKRIKGVISVERAKGAESSE
ncbi:MAG: hypothetical protein AMJ90_00165 [candidate division Zixibacteria bacterium SM23_73_2]|nr:MAG: hypothetical protein AMJ90_00165 [candidate division Zixibacteria bacterium SM23_73_2]